MYNFETRIKDKIFYLNRNVTQIVVQMKITRHRTPSENVNESLTMMTRTMSRNIHHLKFGNQSKKSRSMKQLRTDLIVIPDHVAIRTYG